MDTATIIEELEAERDRLSAAISALQGRKRGPGRPPNQKAALSAICRQQLVNGSAKR